MSRNNTGNPIGSKAFPDFEDNVKNLDQAVNAEQDTFQDRLGKSRLTWAGIVKAGSGDPAIAVDAAARAVAAAEQVEQNAEQIAQDAAQQAADNVVIAVDGAVDRAEGAADRAEAASDAAFVNADVYPDIASGLAAVADDKQFQVVEGTEIVRYRRDSSSTQTPMARYPSERMLHQAIGRTLVDDVDFFMTSNRLDTSRSNEGFIIEEDGSISQSATYAYSNLIKVTPGKTYPVQNLISIAEYDFEKNFVRRSPAATISLFEVPPGIFYVRANYAFPVLTVKGFYDGEESSEPPTVNIPRLDLTGAVSPEDTTFLEPSVNLFDASTVEPGLIDPNTGEVAPGSAGDYFTSDFIKVKPGAEYSQLLGPGTGAHAGFLVVGNYTAQKTFVIRNGTPSSALETYQAPPTIEYIRLTYRGSGDDRMLVEGSVAPTTYIPYGATLKGVRVPGGGGGGYDQVNTNNIVDGAVTPDKTSFIGPSLNLFDPDDVEDFLIIGQDGTPTVSESYKTTGFIPVEPSTDYTWYGSHSSLPPFVYIAQYNSSRQFISRLGLTTVNKQTTRFDTAFVRLMFPRAVDMDRMFAKGSVPPAKFVPFTKTLQGVALSPDAVHEIKVGADAPMLDVAGDLFYSTDDDFDDVAGFNTLSTSDVHSLWDSLMADSPGYITKTVLGDDAFGNSIALYRLSPPRPGTPFNDLLRPKIFLISGIHGGEDVSGFGAYVLANRLCNAWSSSAALEMLRFNVELLVIPVANPSGWNARTRQNGNGVDLNRNFPDGWVESDPEDVTYGGPSPLSELEAQYISQVMQENPDIDMFCDFHNFGAGGGTGGSGNSFVWVSAVPGRYVPHLAQIMMQRLTRKWRTEYGWIPDDPAWFAGYASVSTGGMAKIHALEAHGIDLSATFEVCNVWGLQPGAPLYSPEQKRSTIEALVNWLVMNVKEVVRRG